MKIYIDNCCYNRPFDGYTDVRSTSEVLAIKAIIATCERMRYLIIGSPVVVGEINKTQKQKPEKWLKMLNLYNRIVNSRIKLTPEITARTQEFMTVWPKEIDCYHLALAEAARADFLMTTDDRFENANKRLSMSIVNVINPINLLQEIEKWEQ